MKVTGSYLSLRFDSPKKFLSNLTDFHLTFFLLSQVEGYFISWKVILRHMLCGSWNLVIYLCAHTHTHIYIWIYRYKSVCVCALVLFRLVWSTTLCFFLHEGYLDQDLLLKAYADSYKQPNLTQDSNPQTTVPFNHRPAVCVSISFNRTFRSILFKSSHFHAYI